MRQNPTLAEAALWTNLRAVRLSDYKFRRQHPIDQYIVDFACAQRWLIVEIDGDVHAQDNAMRQDAVREARLVALGYRVLRFTNDDVMHHLSGVLEAIYQACLEDSPSPNPSPLGRGMDAVQDLESNSVDLSPIERGSGSVPHAEITTPFPDGERLGEGAAA
jgi:very-short-patch-repair endonuclease